MLDLRLNFACGNTTWEGFENSDALEYLSAPHPVRRIDLDEPLPYLDGSARLVMISHGLCLRPDKEAILSEFARVLRPGGWLRIDDNPFRFPNGDRDPNSEGFPEGVAPFPEEMRMDRADLARCLIRLGFRVWEHPPDQTMIEDEPWEIREALIGNHSWHESFTMEAQKV